MLKRVQERELERALKRERAIIRRRRSYGPVLGSGLVELGIKMS